VLIVGIVVAGRAACIEPSFWIAVSFGRDLRAVHVDDRTTLRLVRLGAMDRVIDWQEVFLRELIYPLDPQTLPPLGFKSGTWKCRTKAPEARGWQIAMDAPLDRPHDRSIRRTVAVRLVARAGWNCLGRNEQCVDKLL